MAVVIYRDAEGRFKKGARSWRRGKKFPEMSRENHPRWKGGLPKCEICKKQLKNFYAKRCKKHPSDEHRKRMREARIKRYANAHPLWKRKEIDYRTIHTWVQKHLGTPTKCRKCKRDGLTRHKIHWANISGRYKRTLKDWIRLCAGCHKRYDMSRHKEQLK